ncbi:MAG: DUF1178 family protein [Thermodesulfobacteriota bacterium]
MIAFDLECSKGHQFEAWFNNLQSFEKQNARRLVSCPYCNDARVRRILSPVTMKSPARTERERERKNEPGGIDYSRLAKEIVNYIHHNFEDVGNDFAKEALKMHYGVTEKRDIRGEATGEEEKMLRDEKIEFFKIPYFKAEAKKKN